MLEAEAERVERVPGVQERAELGFGSPIETLQAPLSHFQPYTCRQDTAVLSAFTFTYFSNMCISCHLMSCLWEDEHG